MPNLPFIPFAELTHWRQTHSHDQQRLILTNGCFDILHVGHVRYLQATKKLGEILVVGLNSDQSVRAIKGPQRPINAEQDRAEVLAALACVDYVTIFEEPTADALIRALQPTIYTKAGDYTLDTLPERDTLLELGVEVVFIPFVSGYSTTETIAKSNR